MYRSLKKLWFALEGQKALEIFMLATFVLTRKKPELESARKVEE